jgi:hypothetical protein
VSVYVIKTIASVAGKGPFEFYFANIEPRRKTRGQPGYWSQWTAQQKHALRFPTRGQAAKTAKVIGGIPVRLRRRPQSVAERLGPGFVNRGTKIAAFRPCESWCKQFHQPDMPCVG